jgi:hypothetical protein
VIDAAAVRRRANELAEERLLRERALLRAVSPAERRAIEDVARTVALRVADCLLGEAERCPPIAGALADEDDARGFRAARGGRSRGGAEKEGFEPSKEVITPLTP